MICAEFTASSPKLARKTTALNWRPDLPHAEQRKNATRFCRGRCAVFELLETGPSSMDSVAIATGAGLTRWRVGRAASVSQLNAQGVSLTAAVTGSALEQRNKRLLAGPLTAGASSAACSPAVCLARPRPLPCSGRSCRFAWKVPWTSAKPRPNRAEARSAVTRAPTS